ncbi:MAG: hypothetical protein AAFX62_05360 [Pseudomonadota bacterium]
MGQLTDAEQASLREIARGTVHGDIPFTHAEKLIRLGLAELVCGDQELTGQGRRAVGMLAR